MERDGLDDLVLASPLRRIAGGLIDLASAYFIVVTGAIVSNFSHRHEVLLGLAPVLTLLALQTWMLATRGQTLGKWACGVRIVRLDHVRADLWRVALIRLPTQLLLAILVLVDVLVMTLRVDRRSLGDLFAGTLVVRSRHAHRRRALRAPPPVMEDARRMEIWRLAPTLLIVFFVACATGSYVADDRIPDPYADACR